MLTGPVTRVGGPPAALTVERAPRGCFKIDDHRDRQDRDERRHRLLPAAAGPFFLGERPDRGSVSWVLTSGVFPGPASPSRRRGPASRRPGPGRPSQGVPGRRLPSSATAALFLSVSRRPPAAPGEPGHRALRGRRRLVHGGLVGRLGHTLARRVFDGRQELHQVPLQGIAWIRLGPQSGSQNGSSGSERDSQDAVSSGEASSSSQSSLIALGVWGSSSSTLVVTGDVDHFDCTCRPGGLLNQNGHLHVGLGL